MNKVKDILRYISPNTSFVVNRDSDDTDYWIEIQGYRISLTEEHFIALHEARIQPWDKATEGEIAFDYEDVVNALKALIKGEQK